MAGSIQYGHVTTRLLQGCAIRRLFPDELAFEDLALSPGARAVNVRR
jgi:hypothetical protein